MTDALDRTGFAYRHMIEPLPQSTLAEGVRASTRDCASSPGRVIDAVYPADTDFDTHQHDEAYLCLVVAGGYREWSGACSRSVGTGRDLVYGPGSRHAVRVDSRGLRLLHVTDPSGRSWRPPASPLAAGYLWQIAALLSENRRHGISDDDALHVDALVLELVDRPCRPAEDGAWVDAVADRLREQYREAPSLAALAEVAGRHPAHLVRAFRHRFGLTPGAFLRRVRVAVAVTRLRESDDPLSFVAAATGFADQSHMGRWVRRLAGSTPLEIRRGARTVPRCMGHATPTRRSPHDGLVVD